MSELHKYYAKRLIMMLVGLLGASALLDGLHDDAVPMALFVSDLLNNHFVLVALLLGGELFIRKCLWRYEKPHLNFNGRWRGETTYTRRWLDNSKAVAEAAEHEVDIEQDCLSVAIAPTKADAFAQWHSLICDLVPDGIAYAYKVTYSGKPDFPAEARGYEVLNVVKKGRRGLPESISGSFHHFVSDDKPVFSGTARFERLPKRRIWQLRSRVSSTAAKTSTVRK